MHCPNLIKVFQTCSDQLFKNVQIDICKLVQIKTRLTKFVLTKPLHDRAVGLIAGYDVDRQIGLSLGKSCCKKIVFATLFIFVVIAAKTDDARPSHFRLKPRSMLEKVEQNMGTCFAGWVLDRVDEINGINHYCLVLFCTISRSFRGVTGAGLTHMPYQVNKSTSENPK